MNKSVLILLSFLTLVGCDNKNDYNLLLTKGSKKSSDLDIPIKINVNRIGNFIVIRKGLKDSLSDKITLFERDGDYYTLDYQYDDSWNYVGMNRSLFFKNTGRDSCFSVDKGFLEYSKFQRKQIVSKDFCFNKMSKNKYRTVIQYTTEDNHAFSETYFYDKKYNIEKIVLRQGSELFTYE